MAKQFDATLNAMIDAHLEDWAAFLASRCGVPLGPASALDTDLSSTLQADRLFRIDGATPAALHLELESTGRLGIPDELLRYNVNARSIIGLPVHSVLVLLRPKATASDLTGQLDVAGANGEAYLTFRYSVVRVWQEPADVFLNAGLGLAPLALLTNEAATNLRGTFERLRERLRTSGIADNVEHGLLGSTFVLCGLRYQVHDIEALYQELSMTLEDSTTYQEILNRGRTAEARANILLLGGKRFRAAPAPVEAAVKGLAVDRLERIVNRLLEASDWNDLLATP